MRVTNQIKNHYNQLISKITTSKEIRDLIYNIYTDSTHNYTYNNIYTILSNKYYPNCLISEIIDVLKIYNVKKCSSFTNCKNIQHIQKREDFSKSSKTLDKLRTQCKTCINQKAKDKNRLDSYYDRLKTDPNEFILCDDFYKMNTYTAYGQINNIVLFDTYDYDKIKNHKWCTDGNGYIISTKLNLYLHRFIMLSEEEINDLNIKIDHINRQTNDNRKLNLRKCTHIENSRNSNIRNTNTSGYTGISWNKSSNKWHTYIIVNGYQHNLGHFINLDSAINIRLKAEKKYFKEFAPN